MLSESTPNSEERDALLEVVSEALDSIPHDWHAKSEFDGVVVDAVLAAGYRRQETPQIMVGSRQSGKARALIDDLLDRANERGVKVEIVEPEPVAVATERERCAGIVEKYWPINPFWADAIAKRIREIPVTEEGKS